MEPQNRQIEKKLETFFQVPGMKDEKIDQIWKKVELNSQKQPGKPGLGWRLAALGLGVFLIVIFAIGPGNVWAQMRAWLIPGYRPISQLENYQIVPEKNKETHDELVLSLLSAQSFERELIISILVQGIDPVDPDTLAEQPSLKPAYLILENGEVIKPVGGSYGIGDGDTEYVYELTFPALGNDIGTKVQLVVPDLPYILEPLEEDWVVSMTIDPIRKEDQVPQIAQQTENLRNPQWVQPEIVSVIRKGVRNEKILVRFDMPQGYRVYPLGTQFWSLKDEDGKHYFFNIDRSCSINCPENEITIITESILPTGKTYTLTMPRFSMATTDYGDFYEEDGKTYLPAFLTIDFPENYKAGDFIKIDQWYDIPPFQFHLLGIEILTVDEEQVHYRIVMQSPESSNALMDIMLCVNQFVKGRSCGGGAGYDGEKRPQADELIYSTGSFPRELLIGEVGFYLHQISFAYFPDWELNFDLEN